MWIKVIVFVYLCILGILDSRERQIPVLLLGIGGVMLAGVGIYQCIYDELGWIEMMTGIIPGFFMILVARFTQKAGLGDGVVLIQLGICMGFHKVLLLLCFSMFLLSVVCIVLLITRKVRKETQMPYLTFLATTFLLGIFGGG